MIEVEGLGLDEVRDVHVILAPTRRIRGQVVDELGAPVPFARVQLLEPPATNDRPTTRIALPRSSNFAHLDVRRERDFQVANAVGCFELGCEVAGSLLLRAWYADAMAPGRRGSPASFDARQLDTLRVQGTELAVPTDRGLGGEVFDVELELAARVRVEGRLTTWTQAMGGFDLVLVPRHGVGPPAAFATEQGASCTLDAEGRFSFGRIAPGSYGLHARFGVQPWSMTGVQRATPLIAELEVPVAGLTDVEVTPLCALPELVPLEVECLGDLHGALVVRASQIDLLGAEDRVTSRYVRIEPGHGVHLPIEPAGRWRRTVFDERDCWSMTQEVDRGVPCELITLRLDLAIGRVRLVDVLGTAVSGKTLEPIPADGGRVEGRFSGIRKSDSEGVLELCLPLGPVLLGTMSFPTLTPAPGGALDWPPLPGTTIVLPGS